jgi:hypothetical protein
MGKAEGSPPTVIETSDDTTAPFCQPHDIGISGSEWMEVPFRLSPSPVRPQIVIETLAQAVRRPAVGEDNAVIAYDGVLDSGARLVLDPDKGASLFVLPLLDDDGKSRADPADPSGFRAFDQGYVVLNLPVGRALKGGTPLRVTVAGKAAAEGQSLVNLHFTAKGESRDVPMLANRFTGEWQAVNETVKAPADADTLGRIDLYRFQSKGRVWYGPVKVERADVDVQGQDVSASLRGAFPSLSAARFHLFRYTDDELPSLSPRVRVQLVVPPAK